VPHGTYTNEGALRSTVFPIFSVVDALLLRPLPYPHPDRLAAVGIVLALGARPANFIGLVIRQGMQLTLIGILAGLTGAAVLTRVIANLLFGVSTTLRSWPCQYC
jgi:hypothetical protein